MASGAEPRSSGGRRHYLTVLFTDLCGSTRLGRGMEPEEFDQMVSALRSLVEEEARQRGGVMVRAQGDGTLVVFGYPHALEDDGVRAAEVALAVRARLGTIPRPGAAGGQDIAVRSGLHSGKCLVSEGDARLGTLDLQGDVVNTAATLQQLAEPGAIVASRTALGPHDNMFEVLAIPRPVPLRGSPKAGTWEKLPPQLAPVAVQRRLQVQRRFDATARRGLTPFIGRDEGMGFLQEMLRTASGSPRCGVVQAGPGLGKTRLLEEFLARPRPEGWTVLRGNCESFGTGEVLQPFLQMVRGAEVPPKVDELARHFAAVGQSQRVLLVIDDWQWADDASRQLAGALLERADGPRMVLLARPREDGQPWIAGAPHLTLRPFELDETAAAVARWMPAADPFLVNRIHEYAGGVPLYIEELCHSAAEDLWQNLEGRAPVQSWLSNLVAARLSRLARAHPGTATQVRAAAVVGNVVPLELLRQVCETPVTPESLRQLAEADFLYPDEGPDRVRFKHGITRDAVYEAIGLYERTALHQRIEEVLLARGGETGRPEDLEALAAHARGAGHWERAARFAERAGDRAIDTFAMDRARAQYHAALDALDHLPRSPECTRRWCAVSSKLGLACIFDPLSLGDDYLFFEQAVMRARELDDPNMLARAQYWLAYIHYGLGGFRQAKVHASEALQLARASGDLRLAAQVEATQGQILAGACEYHEALALMEVALRAKQLASKPGHHALAIGSAYTLACKGSVLADRGSFGEAHDCFDEALHLLAGSTHPVGNSVRNWLAISLIWQGRWEEAEQVAAASARIAENTRALLLLAVSRAAQGFAQWNAGREVGLEQMRQSVRWITTRGSRFFISLFEGWLCEVDAAAGDMGSARRSAAAVLRRARDGERIGEAVACRAMARACAQTADARGALRWLQRADRSAAIRGSAREQALNDALRARLVEQPAPHVLLRA